MGRSKNNNKLNFFKSYDDSLIRRIKKNDHIAFKSLFTTYYKDLVKYANKYVHNLQTAEDIVSEVFLKLWEKRQEINIKINVKAYLFKMVRNQSLNLIKSQKLDISDSFYLAITIKSDLLPEDEVNIKEIEKQIELAISELPSRTKEVFTLHKYDDLKYSEIAEILNIKIGTVETHMVRALKYLRKRLAFLITTIFSFF